MDIKGAFFPHGDSEAVKQGPREVMRSLSSEFFKTQRDLESPEQSGLISCFEQGVGL